MVDPIGIVLSLVVALGVGGILGAYFQSIFQHRREVKEREHELKRTRYGCILILMLTQLDPKVGLPHAQQFRSDLKDVADVKKEIETELLHGVVFAGDEVISSLSEFIRDPTYQSFVRVAASMRRDLWGKRTKVDEKVLDVLMPR